MNPLSCLLMRTTSSTEPAWQQLVRAASEGQPVSPPCPAEVASECTALLWVTCPPGVPLPPPRFRILDTATLGT